MVRYHIKLNYDRAELDAPWLAALYGRFFETTANISPYVEAVEHIAKQYDVTVEGADHKSKGFFSSKIVLSTINCYSVDIKKATQFSQEVLHTNLPDGKLVDSIELIVDQNN